MVRNKAPEALADDLMHAKESLHKAREEQVGGRVSVQGAGTSIWVSVFRQLWKHMCPDSISIEVMWRAMCASVPPYVNGRLEAAALFAQYHLTLSPTAAHQSCIT